MNSLISRIGGPWVALLVGFFLIVGLVIFSVVSPIGKPNPYAAKSSIAVYDPKSDPNLDLKKAILEAKKTNKNIIVLIGGDWCPSCVNFDSFLYLLKSLLGFRKHEPKVF
jgi:thiol-disulfide isomerase/thioredoxin